MSTGMAQIDISYLNIRGTFYSLCSLLDGYFKTQNESIHLSEKKWLNLSERYSRSLLVFLLIGLQNIDSQVHGEKRL